MQIEWHQLDLCFESLRPKSHKRERSLLGSLSEHGQQTPVVVIAAEVADRYQLIDGYKRVRALRRSPWPAQTRGTRKTYRRCA